MLPEWYNDYKKIIDESIIKYLDWYFTNWSVSEWLTVFKEAVYYSVKWWKRIRSILALEFYLIFTWKNINDLKLEDDIIMHCISLELMHWYSLVHDDLPCMDNDELRRWELTVWKKYWETNATLVWDLLNSMSFEILANLSDNIDIKMILWLFWRSVWFYWMIWWQVLDSYYEKNSNSNSLEKIMDVHNKKTWALIEASIVWWIIISEKFDNMEKYIDFWKKIWLAFQIKDDLLDVEWTFEDTGKSVWGEKKWFVHFMWIEKTRKYLDDLIIESKTIINDLDSDKLIFLVNYVSSRTK